MCTNCTAGRFGKSPGTSSPSCDAVCNPGYVCPAGSAVGSPVDGMCPAGKYAFAGACKCGARHVTHVASRDGPHSFDATVLSNDLHLASVRRNHNSRRSLACMPTHLLTLCTHRLPLSLSRSPPTPCAVPSSWQAPLVVKAAPRVTLASQALGPPAQAATCAPLGSGASRVRRRARPAVRGSWA